MVELVDSARGVCPEFIVRDVSHALEWVEVERGGIEEETENG